MLNVYKNFVRHKTFCIFATQLKIIIIMKLKEITIKGQIWVDDDATDEQIIQTVEATWNDDVIDDDNPVKSVDWLDYDVIVEK
jgi:hypothetical protein